MPESLVVLRHCEDVLLELTSCCGLRSAQQRVSSKATFTLSIRPSQGSVKAGAIQQHRPQMPPRREWFTISVVDAIHAGPAFWGFIIVTLFAPTWYFTADGYHQANAGSPAHAEHSFARQLTLGGVPQFFEVTPKLYRGGQPTTEGFDSLAGMGNLGMEYVPMPWHCPFPKDKIFARFLTLLRQKPREESIRPLPLGR